MVVNNEKLTSLDDLLDSSHELNESKTYDVQQMSTFELMSLFTDIDCDFNLRIQVIQRLNKIDYLLALECINNVITMFINSKSSLIKSILIELARYPLINFTLRVRCIQALEDGNPNLVDLCDELYIEVMLPIQTKTLEYKREYQVSTVYFWDIYRCLLSRKSIQEKLKSDENLKQDIIYIGKSIVVDPSIDEEFRYKLVQTICRNHQVQNDIKLYLIQSIYITDFKDYKFYIYILQLLIQTNVEDEIKLNSYQLDYLISLIQTKKLDNNGTADICDFLLSLEKKWYPEYHEKAIELINSISFQDGDKKTFYNNMQNIHKIDVSESIIPFIELLLQVDLSFYGVPLQESDQYFPFIQTFTNQLVSQAPEKDRMRVESSVKRFILDNTLYSKYSLSLIQLLIRSYYYIDTHDSRDELVKRLCEELNEMADTCTTGHIYRLVNVFSGYELTMKMPVEDEVQSCVFARLQKCIEQKSDEEQDEIYSNIGDEFVFYRHLSKEVSTIVTELRKEYVEQQIIDEQQLDIYVRKAISLFQTGESI